MKSPTKRKLEPVVADLWKGFYQGPGRPAIAALFDEFGLYSSLRPDAGQADALRCEGQRDVLLRLVQMIGRRPDEAPLDVAEDRDIVDRIIDNR